MCAGNDAELEQRHTKDPHISDSFKPLGEGPMQFNVQQISK